MNDMHHLTMQQLKPRTEALWLPSIFSEGMVLQRDVPVPIWGVAAPGSMVTVGVYAGATALATGTATALDNGRWRTELPPMPVGGRYSLLVVSKGPGVQPEEMRLFSNVWVGEVWITCGQSNMNWPMNFCAERDDAMAHRDEYPRIRIAMMGRRDSRDVTEPQCETGGYWGPVKWEEAAYTVTRRSGGVDGGEIPGASSAVSYFFARALSQWLGAKVPVGMIELCEILPVESWVDDARVARTPELAHLRGREYPHATSRAFHANIAPLAPYAVRGVIYYQGSMNAGRPADYYHGLSAMIPSWRAAWDRPDLPFLVMQLDAFLEHLGRESALDMSPAQLAVFDGRNSDHPYCAIREAQLRVSREASGVGLAVIIDTGEKFDIHARSKRPVGERLARLARGRVYGDRSVVAESPRPRTFQRQGARYQVRFDHVGGGLTARGKLDGFEVRDASGCWHQAQAEIRGDTVEAWSDAVSEPAGVRYAWAGYPPVTLFSMDGLPATPFQHPTVEFGSR
jgi:sialate O-acetylesterase